MNKNLKILNQKKKKEKEIIIITTINVHTRLKTPGSYNRSLVEKNERESDPRESTTTNSQL